MRRASMRRMREDPERRRQRREVGQRQHGQPARQRQRFRQLRHRGCAWTVHLRGAASLGGQVVLSQARVFLLGAVALRLQLADPAVPLRVQAARLAGVGEASGGPVDVAFVRGEQPQERVARRTGERGNLEREVLPGGGAGVEVGRQVERAGPLDQVLQALVDALEVFPRRALNLQLRADPRQPGAQRRGSIGPEAQERTQPVLAALLLQLAVAGGGLQRSLDHGAVQLLRFEPARRLCRQGRPFPRVRPQAGAEYMNAWRPGKG